MCFAGCGFIRRTEIYNDFFSPSISEVTLATPSHRDHQSCDTSQTESGRCCMPRDLSVDPVTDFVDVIIALIDSYRVFYRVIDDIWLPIPIDSDARLGTFMVITG